MDTSTTTITTSATSITSSTSDTLTFIDVTEISKENIICDIPDLTCSETISPTLAVYYDVSPLPNNSEWKIEVEGMQVTYEEFTEIQNKIPKYFIDNDVTTYKNVWCNLLIEEKIQQNSEYLSKKRINESWTREISECCCGLKLSMRDLVVGWMQEVCMEEKCDSETFYLSCLYLDTLVCQTNIIDKSNLQKFAATCMLIASKFKQTCFIHPLSLYEYTDRSVTPDEITECEMVVVERLKWELSQLSPHPFLTYLLYKLLPSNSSTEDIQRARRHANTFIDLAVTSTKFSTFSPSQIACACVLLSISGLYSAATFHKCFLASTTTLFRVVQGFETYDCQEEVKYIVRELGVMFQSQTKSSSSLPLDQVTTDPSIIVFSSNEGDLQTTPKYAYSLLPIQTSTPSDVKEITLKS